MGNIVAIVGRPNVGKSTLFNRLTQTRQAIVNEEAGTTRDRQYGKAEWTGKEFSLIDTGGWVINSDDVFEEEINKQVKVALEEADVILFVVDVLNGVTDLDNEVAAILRRAKKPVIVVANKADNFELHPSSAEFYSFGLGDPLCISAINGSCTGDLLDKIVATLPDDKQEMLEEELPRIAIIGRPNAGKSSLINAFIGEDRHIVTDIAGTTRDSIYTKYNKFGLNFYLVDTAGIRKKGKVNEDLEYYSVIRSIRAIENSDVCVLMLDATRGIESQDLNIFSLVQKNKKGLVVCVNKWDLVEDKSQKVIDTFTSAIRERLAPFTDFPILFISALTKQRILKVLEEVEIGHPAVSKIEPGTCAYVPTGGMVPEGADAMVMVEYSERFGTDEVALYENVPYGKCIVLPGEDVKTGDIVLKAGTRIGPAQAGTLAALGVVQVPVFKPWKVAVLSTGDELVRIDQVPGPGQVRDINTWALSCYVKKTGLELVSAEAVRDEEVLLEEKIREAVKACDLILISGGSSQGKKDMTMEILNRISKEGVFTHGLALKPGKPTILGYDKEKHTLLGGLPGHPAAALAVFHLLFVWLWKQVTGQPDQPPLEAFMTTNLAGAPGKTTCLLVKLQMAPQGLEAEPVFGKSGLISTMAEADGYVLIDMNQEGLKKGEQVKVYRF